jgi:transcriptional regulator with XRE-family HTH domain
MTHHPHRWAVLGLAIRGERDRQGLTREQLAERVRERGLQVTSRSIGSLETGVVPKKRAKPPTLEPVVAALGWRPGWTDRILAGEDPSTVLQQDAPVSPAESPRARLLELVPGVYEFSRTAARLGAPASLRDDFDHLVQELLDHVDAQASRGSLALAASRPHAPAEGVPADDAARIEDAIRRNG